jgi:hypothetical protein
MAAEIYTVDILIAGDEKISAADLQKIKDISGGQVFIFRKNKWSCRFNSLIALLANRPLQSSYFYFKEADNKLKEIAPNYEAIYSHTIRFGKYLDDLLAVNENYKNSLILDFNDAISLNYQEAKIKARGLWKLIYAVEEKRVKNYELYFLRKLKFFGIITRRDRDYLLKNWAAEDQSPAPEIDLLSYIFCRHSNLKYAPKTKNLVFAGNTNYPPNGQGLRLFISLIWPLIRKTCPESNLILIGRGTDKFNDDQQNIQGLGFVEKADEIIVAQKLFLNPVAFGAGISTKALWAMSLALPIVSTPVGMAGLEDIEDGKNVIYFDYREPKKTAEIIISAINETNELLNGVNRLVEIGARANEIIDQYYSEKKNKESFLNLLKKNRSESYRY